MQHQLYWLLIPLTLLFSSSGSAQSNPTDSIKTASIICMVGNSITHHGDWQKVLGRKDVTNWGIPGYTTEQISWTIKNLMPLHPKVCFLEGGINDLTLGITSKRVYQNQIKVMDTLLAHGIIPVMQSTIYQYNSKDDNKRVKKVNKLIKKYCTKHQVDYLDLNAILSNNNELKKELTTDGTHLQPDAYILWAALVKNELEKLKL